MTLAEQLEAATVLPRPREELDYTETLRLLDATIAMTFKWKPMGDILHWVNDWEAGFEHASRPGTIRMVGYGPNYTWEVPRYSNSLDACIALVEQKLPFPVWDWAAGNSCHNDGKEKIAWANINKRDDCPLSDGVNRFYASAPTPCLAMLRALGAATETDRG